MAHYTIDLPGDIKADVRQGRVFKKRLLFAKRWPWIKINSEVRTGYLVIVEDALHKNKNEYHLLRTKEGKWQPHAAHEPNAAIKIRKKWQPVADNFITLAVKKAIDHYENKQ